ncbi:proteasome subunit beta type-4-like [Drosophila guanche]|uniref:Proteasome subunit beta n=1 Tax=Drosophila guanche TaxID=7266 RepID=A0A3B0JSX5_DROGU|nr:proteasome subunit beta type-4-like [Drosophila guanche]SPP85195.1 blast:Proteasome subunit beta type-4 [Drosophila guanche]
MNNQEYERASTEQVDEFLKFIGLNKDPGRVAINMGASVIGIRFDTGVVVAADTCVHYGSMPRFQSVDRVFKINEQIVMGGSGDFADIQMFKRTIDAQVITDRIYQDTAEMKPKSLAGWLRQITYARRSSNDLTPVSVVVGGMEPNAGPYLSYIDFRGVQVEDYVATTDAAQHMILPMVRDKKPKDREFTEEEAIALIRQGMESLHYRDSRAIPYYTVGFCAASGCHIEGPYKVNEDWTLVRHSRPQ